MTTIPSSSRRWAAAFLTVAAFGSEARAQGTPAREPVPIAAAPVSDVRDTAGLFGEEAVAKAKERLQQVERAYRVPVVIETLDTLGGAVLTDVATRHARREVGQGVFILLVKREAKTEMLVSREFASLFSSPLKETVRLAFNHQFARSRFDEGLRDGIQEIETILSQAKTEGKLPLHDATARMTAGPSPALVLRNQVRLTLAGARRVVEGAEAGATALGIKVNVAVVDDGGHLLTFERMDGARPASGYTAMTKATTAATFRAATGPLTLPGASAPDPLLNLSLQNAAAASGGKLTTLHGGLPILVEGQVIGGVGVGGGSGEQDAVVARAGIDAFLADLPAAKP